MASSLPLSSSPSRRRPKRPAADETPHDAPATSPSSNWIRSIQNQSFQPKPTAYSPHTREDEDPLMQQQRQCRDKLRALRQVRERIHFYALKPLDKRRTETERFSMDIGTSMILSGDEKCVDWQEEDEEGLETRDAGHNVGIDALGSLEMLLFSFFSRQELLNVSGVCRAWRALARDDLFWEPLLVTSLEKYPLRPLLGLERDPTDRRDHVPAILVYMVFQRLRLAQAPQTTDCSTATGTAAAPATARYSDRVLQYLRNLGAQTPNGAGGRLLPRLIRPAARGQGGVTFSSVHLVCVQTPSFSLGLREQEDQEVTQLEHMHLQPQREQGEAPAVGAQNGLVLPANAPNPPTINGQQPAGVADDEDVYSIVDGRHRETLSSWISTKERVSERTLRSFLWQMLLSVHAMELANCEHVDISPVNIVVHCQRGVRVNAPVSAASQPQAEEDGDEEGSSVRGDDDVEMMDVQNGDEKSGEGCRGQKQQAERHMPMFQLFLSRRNYQQVGGTGGRVQDPAIAVEGDVEAPVMFDMDEGGVRGIAQQRQRLAEMGAEIGGVAAVLGNRLAFPQQNMISSVIQCAVTVWARGRFVDTNSSSLLTLLLRFPACFSCGLRTFLEYAKYLIISHSASATKLLCHEYLQSAGDEISRQSAPHWCTTPIHDVNEYKSKLVAHYSSLPSRLEPLRGDDSSLSVSSSVMEELMPRTKLGFRYFAKALREGNLSSERFVSVVAPSTASSSWVRMLARTQTHTLQRLDLSQARVPTSVLLQELTTLPRLTHLRLPRQILRDENLEHLVAALAYSGLLPRLRGLDENVRQAMDRMEKSYLMQLDMFSFLLQKPSASSTSAAAGDC